MDKKENKNLRVIRLKPRLTDSRSENPHTKLLKEIMSTAKPVDCPHSSLIQMLVEEMHLLKQQVMGLKKSISTRLIKKTLFNTNSFLPFLQ